MKKRKLSFKHKLLLFLIVITSLTFVAGLVVVATTGIGHIWYTWIIVPIAMAGIIAFFICGIYYIFANDFRNWLKGKKKAPKKENKKHKQ